MLRMAAILWAVAAVITTPGAFAVTPPPSAPLELKVCAASHIFLGTGANLRVVRLSGMQCPGLTMGSPATLDLCEVVEVDVTVDEVLIPQDWKPPTSVVFQFGGGLFSVKDLRQALEGRRRIYLTKPAKDGERDVFRTSYPWMLGASEGARSEVEAALKSCAQKPGTTVQ